MSYKDGKGLVGKPFKDWLRSLGLFSLVESEGTPQGTLQLSPQRHWRGSTDLCSVTSDRIHRNHYSCVRECLGWISGKVSSA